MCPICLTEFVEGDEIRVLLWCGHGFHAACIDLWLGSHSSYPSCSQFPVVGAGVPPGCRKCDQGAVGSRGVCEHRVPDISATRERPEHSFPVVRLGGGTRLFLEARQPACSPRAGVRSATWPLPRRPWRTTT
ncbi:hypothetical protein Taro_053405 [Colocasia esculenta]|uniref:RING-type domain-containing protein n=1 Tax=Colocasia esculenta TaxID=4460 RepID=A0A843XN31_COLES|nr:hypothetical protein [Colocasia esculenta]